MPIDELTEHSKRSALENLLKQSADEYQNKDNKIIVLHEPKRKENYGSPDFKIYTASSIIGYVENKKVTEILDKILKSDQIKKYRELSDNILLTNYIDFVWIKGDLIEHETLCYLSDLENKKFKLDKNKEVNVKELLKKFFSQAPKGIASPKELALALAIRGKNLKEYLTDELDRQSESGNKGALYDVYDIFKNHVFNELTVSEFGDAFAQMLVYGLFLAKLNADTKEVSLENIKKYIPTTFQLIHELVRYLDELNGIDYNETKWIVDETISIMNNLDLFELKKNLTFSKKIKDNENIDTDPYIYFYETFLTAYDSKLRKSKGVYYTPPQVVNFIVRAINNVLQNTFKILNGFADRNSVTVLDFATGTGTFLIEVFKQIFETIPHDSDTKRDLLIREHILKNIYGFEYLIAPYTIAHLKLSQFLIENGYKFQTGERLQVFLTNTLEPIDKQIKIPTFPALTEETKQAQEVKNKPILVITGNPPYSGVSKNNGLWISNLIDDYKYIDDVYFDERKHWLNDDYVKFIRFAQHKMQKVEQGIIGIITNHSFLDNPTFRGMRKSLMNTFDQLYFIDLHGNAKKKEKTPVGEKDENVFDIEQGVCISLMIKKSGLEKKIYYTDFWGKRTQKYNLCIQNSLETVDFKEIKPNAPFYFFKDRDELLREKYDNFWSVTDIFAVNNTGICSQRDSIAFQFDKVTLKNILTDFSTLKEHEIREKYELEKDGRDWTIATASNNVKQLGIKEEYIREVDYRPFDVRYTYYTNKSKGFIAYPRFSVLNNMNYENNLGLCVGRAGHNANTDVLWNLVIISNKLIDLNIFYRGGEILCPLYLYENKGMFSQNKNEIKILKDAEKKYNEHEKILISAKKLFNKNKNVSILDKQVYEEQLAIFEEIKTEYEILKRQYEKSLSNEKIENFKSAFRTSIDTLYNKAFSPEQILGYIYAVLNSEIYRSKYAVFLRTDYPKIPLTNDIAIFEKLSNIGFNLIEKHLLKTEKINPKFANIGIYKGKGDNIVIKTQYIDNKLYINDNQYFDNVPEKIFDFYIGGYKVLDKYLKDRKNRSIYNDFEHIENIIRALADTIETMQEIDKLTNEWI